MLASNGPERQKWKARYHSHANHISSISWFEIGRERTGIQEEAKHRDGIPAGPIHKNPGAGPGFV
jgi:hypothetical protein